MHSYAISTSSAADDLTQSQLHHDMTYGATSHKHRVSLLFRKASAAYDRQMLCFDFESPSGYCMSSFVVVSVVVMDISERALKSGLHYYMFP